MHAVSHLRSLHVLVVEDECMLRDDITSYLRDRGCAVDEADTAEQAIAMCAAGLTVDVLFTDIHLKGMTEGWEVAEAFRAARPAIGVLYASGNSADQSRCVSGSRFFTKPYDRCEILRACWTVHKRM
jgi:CheY-like chemotaxis protein